LYAGIGHNLAEPFRDNIEQVGQNIIARLQLCAGIGHNLWDA